MRLSYRSGAHRLRLEGGEELGHRHADVGLDDGAHLGETPRRHAVLQRAQRLDVDILQDASSHRRDELTHFNVDSTQA